MKKEKYMPYGINLKYELKTYKNVGNDYGDRKIADRGIIENVCRFFRKKRNNDEKRYAFCNTYTEWKKHVKSILAPYCEYENLIHWLMKKIHDEESMLEAIKVVLIPAYLVVLSVYDKFLENKGTDGMGLLVLLTSIVVFESTIALFRGIYKVKFYNDYLNVVQEIKKESN